MGLSSLRTCTILPLFLALAACSPSMPPVRELSLAEQAVGHAATSKAPELAPIDYRTAQRKLIRAKELAEEENYSRARRMSEQARVDAEFAEARAEAIYSEQLLGEARTSVRALQEESRGNPRLSAPVR